MSTLSKNQRLLLRRGTRIQSAFDAWKAVGSPSTAAWLDNFIAEHDAMCDEFNRVKDAGEDIVLHPVGWSLHYRRAQASRSGRSDEYWVARFSPRDPALEHLLANEAVPVLEGTGEDDSDDEDLGPGVPRESKWWKFKDAEPRPAADDRHVSATPVASVLSPATGAVPATRPGRSASAQEVEETSAGSRAHASPRSPSLPTGQATESRYGQDSVAAPTESSPPMPARGSNREPSGATNVQDTDQDRENDPGTSVAPTKVRHLIDRILRGRRQSESETRDVTSNVHEPARSITPRHIDIGTFSRRTESSPASRTFPAKRVSFRLPGQTRTLGLPREIDPTSVIPQKRKRVGLGSDTLDRQNTSGLYSNGVDTDSDSAGDLSLTKTRKLSGHTGPAEDADDAEADEFDETEADDEAESDNGHRMLTRRAAAKLHSTPPSHESPQEVELVEPEIEKPARIRIQRPRRPFTIAELEFMNEASKIKRMPCKACEHYGKRCIQAEVGRSCKTCRARRKCTHVAAGNRGGSFRFTPSHYWESLLRNAARPIPKLPPVPYLYPLDQVDKLGVDREVLISKLCYPKTVEEAEKPLDMDDFSGIAAATSDLQPMSMDVDSGHLLKKLPRHARHPEPPSTATSSHSALDTASDTSEMARVMAALQSEVQSLRLEQRETAASHNWRLSAQEAISASHDQRLSVQESTSASHGRRLDMHERHITDIQETLPKITTGMADMTESHRRMEGAVAAGIEEARRGMEKEVSSMMEYHRRVEKEVAGSREGMEGMTAAMKYLVDKFTMVMSPEDRGS
ncbi:hypothetical protein EVG20_g7158 [Dentipellis fragilis]|uniref:Uncharacterized protein n=1 Tax=Dentipellis fragilis TaxID=205917 RepID=A0A4Y9YG28_9AGAM|nr:hypothetical protein EVG20_g7158 [Dentipellis fragilis]